MGRNIKRCTRCGRELKANGSNFYKSYSELNSDTERMSVCKKCVLKIYDKYKNYYRNDKKAIYYMCRLLDVYFENDLFYSAKQQAETQKSNIAQIYFQKVNSLMQYRGYSFDQSDSLMIENNNSKNKKDDEFLVTKDIIDFWGKGFSQEEYRWLTKEYGVWTSRHKCETYSEEVLYKEICLTMLDIRNTRESQKGNIDKKISTLQTLMDSANVKPNEKTLNNDDVNTLGLWIRDIERYTPAEYYKDKKKYFDFDNIKEYVDRFILRPLKNLLVGDREFDKEFSITNTNDKNDM